jgi:hypothetical protein
VRRTRSYLIGCAAGALALAVGLPPALAFGAAPPHPATPPRPAGPVGQARSAGPGEWRTVATVPAGNSALLTAITADGPGGAWAVGQVFAAGAPAPLVEHWNGAAWRRTALPGGLIKPGQPYDPATAAAGPRDLWVFGPAPLDPVRPGRRRPLNLGRRRSGRPAHQRPHRPVGPPPVRRSPCVVIPGARTHICGISPGAQPGRPGAAS